MSKRAGIIMGGVTALAIIIAIVAVVASGGSDDKKSVKTASSDTTTTTVAAAPGGGDSAGGGSSSNGSSDGSSSGGQTQGGNQPPYIRDLTTDTDTSDDQGNHVPVGLVDGHAIDPDGPNDQEVEVVNVSWGDGTTSVATKGGNNAFSAQHAYEVDYAGQTVSVKVTVVDSDGATASQTTSITLPVL